MIRKLRSLGTAMEFVKRINADPDLRDPKLATREQLECNLLSSLKKRGKHVLGVYEDGVMTGLFVFLILDRDRYIEMTVGLSGSAEAYGEMAGYLRERYRGFTADFVFNPGNRLLRGLLQRENARFFTEQQKMVYVGPLPQTDASGVEPLSEVFLDQYLAMHSVEVYWTGDRVVGAPEKFSVFVAVEGAEAVGYVDVTNCYEENEPFDVFVKEGHRRRGWGKKLLAAALRANGPRGMGLLVDVDNVPALRLYERSGFVKAPGQNSLTAKWTVK